MRICLIEEDHEKNIAPVFTRGLCMYDLIFISFQSTVTGADGVVGLVVRTIVGREHTRESGTVMILPPLMGENLVLMEETCKVNPVSV